MTRDPDATPSALPGVACRAALLLLVAVTLAGCGWFGAKTRPKADTASAARAPAYPDARPESAARAACPNYGAVMADSTFPRDAIIRGIDSGRATVWFSADGPRVTILSVSSSDPAFGAAAAQAIQQLQCRTDAPTTFEVPFVWRSTR